MLRRSAGGALVAAPALDPRRPPSIARPARDGVGDACPPPVLLPPTVPPVVSSANELCNSGFDVRTNPIKEVVVLQRLQAGIWVEVSRDANVDRVILPDVSEQ